MPDITGHAITSQDMVTDMPQDMPGQRGDRGQRQREQAGRHHVVRKDVSVYRHHNYRRESAAHVNRQEHNLKSLRVANSRVIVE
jgi:hypothetical protein